MVRRARGRRFSFVFLFFFFFYPLAFFFFWLGRHFFKFFFLLLLLLLFSGVTVFYIASGIASLKWINLIGLYPSFGSIYRVSPIFYFTTGSHRIEFLLLLLWLRFFLFFFVRKKKIFFCFIPEALFFFFNFKSFRKNVHFLVQLEAS